MANGTELFENMNESSAGLDFLIGQSPEELLDQIKQIRSRMRIVSIYAVGARHVCWFQSNVKINKVQKTKGAK